MSAQISKSKQTRTDVILTELPSNKYYNLRLYTVNIIEAVPKTKAEPSQMSAEKISLTNFETNLVVDKFTEKLLKTRDDIIQVHHTTFLSTGPEAILSSHVDVKLTMHEGRDPPETSETFTKSVFDKDGEKNLVRWVKVEREKRAEADEEEADEVGCETNEEKEPVAKGFAKATPADEKAAQVNSKIEGGTGDGNTSGASGDRFDDSKKPLGTATRHQRIRLVFEDQTPPNVNGHGLLVHLIAKSKEGDSKATECLQAVLRDHSITEDGRSAFHGNRHFHSDPQAYVQHVELRMGVKKSFVLSPTKQVMLREAPCDQLFFPATSLAAIMESHCGMSASMATVANQQHLTALFRGITVKICGGFLNGASKTIENFSILTPAQQLVPAGKRKMTLSDVYRSSDITVLHANLPCVNVGSAARAFYVAPELCSILIDQPFKHGLTPTLQRELEHTRKMLARRPAIQKKGEPRGASTSLSARRNGSPEVKLHTPGIDIWHHSVMKTAKVIILETGHGEAKHQRWRDFQTVLQQIATKSHGTPLAPLAEVHSSLVRLAYLPGGLLSQELEHTLSQLVNDVSDGRQQITVIFGTPDGDNQQSVAETVSRVCDGLNVHSLRVDIRTISDQFNAEGMAGLVKYCGQIYRKMFARVPDPLPHKTSHSPVPEDMVVAVHVKDISSPGDGSQGAIHLVTMVSRDMRACRFYRSNVRIVDTRKGDLVEKAAKDMLLQILQDMQLGDGGSSFGIDSLEQVSPEYLRILRSGDGLPTSAKEAGYELRSISEAMEESHWNSSANFLMVEDHKDTDLAPAREQAAQKADECRKHDIEADCPLTKAAFIIKAASLINLDEHEGAVLIGGTRGSTATKLTMFKNPRGSHGRDVVAKFPYDADLCELFHDDLLGIYEHPRPIPTYLACKLTTWAGRQMKKRYEKDSHGAKTLVYDPIPAKYEGVQRTLWYL